ncbi:hypothetical protein MRS60_27975 [Burkholderia pyrrocinia]|uniref:hypothetical protein n=1 Tax=Burkholderia pyrrocinia TaxID=60550 RepID=UPI001FB30BC8|nr:hypothetical protein [Burkholderia pyrrocinia]UOB58020.1 hypothetical protein MRS60_27975 [Burkholderia pyrrocinia]
MNGMVRGVKVGAWCNLSRVGVVLCLMAISKLAVALELTDLISGYRNCSWIDQGDGTSKIKLDIDFKDSSGHTGKWAFVSRSIMISTYDKNGTVGPSSEIVPKSDVTMGSAAPSRVWTPSDNSYSMYYGGGSWNNGNQFSGNVVIRINNEKVAAWPGIAVRAGNYTQGYDYGEITGAAYIARGDLNGSCLVIKDPGTPPPQPIAMTMSAPDWDLGELQEGDSTKTFSNSSEKLCVSYSGAAIRGKNFIINASNANGVASNRYRLKNLKDASQLVPYSLTLDSGTSNVSLPNASKTSLPLDSSGKTCFVPTFKTTVDPTVKSGDYSDVLTFTVVTKS